MDNLGDLGALLGPILSDPSAMETLYDTAKSLGLDSLIQQAQSESEPVRAQCNADSSCSAATHECAAHSDSSDDIFSSIIKLAPLLSSINRDDDVTRLLCALRPFLSDEKAPRIENAKKMLRLLRVAAILRESGITGGIL